MREYKKSKKLDGVCYDIRGPVLTEAKRMEEEGYTILKLNIGNPAPFGFSTPDEIVHDMVINLHDAEGYTDAKGIFPARKAIVQYYRHKGLDSITIEDVYIGNGVSELIVMAMQGLLDNGDEILIPRPDYPLWTAAVKLSGGNPIHYVCDEASQWIPDVQDIRKKINHRTKGIVLINPNNPTGSVYPEEVVREIVELAAEHQLIVFSDEIYEKILYDSATHYPPSVLSSDVVCLSFNGLSKSYRAAGFRAGWMIVSGPKSPISDYREGLDILSNMRLCSNVPSQYAIQTALGGYQCIEDLVKPGGRLFEQRKLCWEMITDIPGISCVKPLGALYLFPKLDTEKFRIVDDEQFVIDLLREEKILVVQGTGFNWNKPDHFRIVFLPSIEEMREALTRMKTFMEQYRQHSS